MLGLGQALRSLSRRPWYFAGSVSILALGMGVALALFSITEAVRIRPLPVRDPGALMLLTVEPPSQGQTLRGLSPELGNLMAWPLFERLKETPSAFEGLSFFVGRDIFLGQGAQGGRVQAGFTSSEYFQTLGMQPVAGRFFSSEETWEANPKVVLGYALWISRFGGDPGILGQEVPLDGRYCQVIGVAPRGFEGLSPRSPQHLWVTLGAITRYDEPGQPGFRIEAHGSTEFNTVGRMKPGISVAAAEAQFHGLLASWPEVPKASHGRLLPLSRFQGLTLKVFLPNAALIGVATTLCLLITCLVVANLQLAHQVRNRRETSTRIALGASPWQVAQHLYLENLWLTGLGAGLGLVLSRVLLPIWVAMDGRSRMALLDIPLLDLSALGAALLLAFLACLVTTLIPLIQVLRSAPNKALKEVSSPSVQRAGLQNTLVVLQVALCFSLLGPIAGVVRTLQRTLKAQTAFGRETVEATFSLPPNAAAGRAGLVNRLLEASSHLPGATGAALGGMAGAGAMGPGGVVEAQMWVTRDYFKVKDLPILAGRPFSAGDGDQEVILSQGLANAHFPSRQAVGERFLGRLVVGIVQPEPLTRPFPVQFYYTQTPPESLGSIPLIVRTNGPAQGMLPSLREMVHREVPAAGDVTVETHAQAIARELAAPLMAVTLLSVLGGFSCLLALAGVFSMLTFVVARDRKEVGVRVALGALPSDIASHYIRRGGRLILAGVLSGSAGAYVIFRLMEGLWCSMAAACVGDFIWGGLFLLAAAMVSILLPALSAARMDACQALKDA